MTLLRHFRQGGAAEKGVTIDHDKTSINLNEDMDSFVPASKISDYGYWLDLRTNRPRLREDQDGSGRSDEHTRERGVRDHQVLLQD